MVRIVAAALVALGITGGGWLVGQGFREARAANRFVTVKGVAERPVEADVAIWPLTIVVSDDDLPTAHERLEQSLASVRHFLAERGVSSAQTHLQGFSVTDARAERYGGSSHPSNRYIIHQTLVVRSDAPAAILEASAGIAELLASGVVLQSGASQQGGPVFLFTRLNDLKPEMIAEATARAREAAQEFARDSGTALGGIRRANQGVFQILARDQVPGLGEPQQLHKVVRVVSTVEYLLAP